MVQEPLLRGANALYKGQTLANAALSNGALAVAYRLLGWAGEPPPKAAQRALQQRFDAMMDVDWDNARAGYYPMRWLFASPFLRHGRQLPRILRDAPRVVRRRRQARHDDLPQDVDRAKYPRYYLRNFHWQTDGWFSSHSAELYDASVEVLFGGAADMMRRMVIPPLVDGLAGVDQPRVLDVACGTGEFLSRLKTALPRGRFTGLDLSEAYLDHGRRTHGDAHLVWGNAERMPFDDASFDALTCIFLFHELPRAVRRKVMSELLRVVRPGGRVVIEDSAQLVESDVLEHFLKRFPVVYHEPFYADYLKDDLAEIARGAGFEVIESRPYVVSKVVTLRRPAVN
ncbi:MAG: class I SAM-dependent methyltransferase [Deltaproteobacteria bacterium]